jgi:hypothetical protein
MVQVASSVRQEPDNSVEIVIHVDETLADDGRTALVRALENSAGILSAEFCPLRYHLLLVRYDRTLFNSQEVLGKVNDHDVHGVLIGPV